MADRMYAKIEIGGEIARSRLADLAVAMQADGLVPNQGVDGDQCGRVTVEEVIAELEACAAAGDTITAGDIEASYGQFETLETFCCEHKLTYLRTSSPKYEYDGELVFRGPGTHLEFLANASEDMYVLVNELREAVPPDGSDAEIAKAYREFVDEHQLPDVPPFKIV